MYRKTFYATHPESIYGARNDELRELYPVADLFAEGGLRLNYVNAGVANSALTVTTLGDGSSATLAEVEKLVHSRELNLSR
jgi:5-keto 4-deoxyuronate isomerase